MAVQFILGRSGTGKTSYCINSIAKELLTCNKEPLILLVPEQATYQAERAILADKGIDGYHRLNVLSFDRLEFLLLGKNTARESVSRIGRQMIIHRILRENASKLKIFGSSAHLPGMSQKIAQTIEEIHRYAGTPDNIDDLLRELQKKQPNSSTILKFSDIRLVLSEYLKFVENDFYDPDVQLASVCKAAAKSDITKGVKLWIDGFAGFTGTELVILAELLKAAADSKIALCLDPTRTDLNNPVKENLNETDLFNPTEQTFAELMEMIKKLKLPLLKSIILDKTLRFACPELAHIENNIFNNECPRLKSAENIHIISAPNERSEVQFTARQIVRLVKEKGFRYRDIAVIASDIESYHHYIRAYFDDYDIPFFIDKRKPLSRHPVVELICSALKIITEGFDHHDIFAYLKTDLVPISRYEIDILENYCIAFGISNSDWLDDKTWQFAGRDNKDFDEDQINKIRHKAASALLDLKNSLNNEKVTSGQFTRAVFDFLEDLNVQNTINTWVENAKKEAHFEIVDEHQQFYSKMIDVFDEFTEIFSNQSMPAGDFYSIINSAFSQLTLAFIPPTLDQVLVGSVERSRHPDLKAVFLIGATQRQFPIPIRPDSILSDDDRKTAESLDFPLASSVDRTLCERQYLAYIAFTRPSEILYITYPSVDEKGSGVPRSQFIGDLESLFENLREQSITSGQNDIENVGSENELADLFCERFGKDKLSNEEQSQADILEEICSDKQLSGIGAKVLAAINYDNKAVLEKEITKEMFENKLKGSATRLGTFAACPYRYFAKYVLELKKRKEFSLEPLDLGNFYHSVLDALVKRINAEHNDFAVIDNDALVKIVNEEIEKLIKGHPFLSNFIKRRLYNEYIISSACETLRNCVLAIAQIVRAGSFRPCASEIAFGHIKDSPATLGNFELELPGTRTISLSGKIDRLDAAEIDNEKKVVVFDYKRSDMQFKWQKFYHGLDLQLPIYMLAARHAEHSKFRNIIGAFFIPVEVIVQKTTFAKLDKNNDKFDYKAKGIFNGCFFQHLDNISGSGRSKFYNFSYTSNDEQYGYYSSSGALKPDHFDKVLDFTVRKIVTLSEKILSGIIDVNPYRLGNESPCKNCEFLPVCRFDWQINEYKYLESLNKIQVLENIGGSNG
ncbi:MAG: exodeoxyribonuclease V subunit gamma [Sedimentisphaerales bacterium]|nr:exodeoxyribonuclease V subunit gamma [Sedimentisphaerales bacterium]